MKLNKTLTVSALLAMLPMAGNASTIVYQDTFDDGDIAINSTGIGGGFSQEIGLGTGFTEAGGDIDADTSVNNNRAFGFSTNTFDLSNGFTLDFTANAAAVGGASANRFSVGLAAAGSDFTTFATDGRNFLGDTRFVHEAVGIDFTADQGQGLSFNDGLGPDPVTGGVETIVLSNEQAITAGTDLAVSLTVAADGSYSYSINGATATTGADFGLDLNQEFHFATYFQDDVSDNFTISEVTLSTIPEPSSTALLGLGGLALILRRKK